MFKVFKIQKEREREPMKKYEYKTLEVIVKGKIKSYIDFDGYSENLNKLGQEGWELVNTFPLAYASGASYSIISVLKREVNH